MQTSHKQPSALFASTAWFGKNSVIFVLPDGARLYALTHVHTNLELCLLSTQALFSTWAGQTMAQA